MKANSYDQQLSCDEVSSGFHRAMVGGLWEEIGRLQFQFLLGQGLQKNMRFLDVGCGALRGGVHFIDYLESGNYYGLDVNLSLLEAGYSVELPAVGLQHKLPKENLLLDSQFNFSRFCTSFDMALALSVFTHLPFNHIRVCLIRLAEVMRTNGKFFASAFIAENYSQWADPFHHELGGVTSYPASDPYHYLIKDFEWMTEGLSWSYEYLGDWGHPRNQKMLCFKKL